MSGSSFSSASSSTSSGSPERSSNLHRYDVERRQLAAGIEEVRRRALTGALRVSRLRSLAWAILLGVLPPDEEHWLTSLRSNRSHYEAVKEKQSCDPRRCTRLEDDPLSQDDNSMWNQHFKDNELQTIIKLDVVRTFPGLEFFKQPEIQLVMTNVLFCYARETPHIMYRQGMHEILAPLIFVLQSDHKAAEHSFLGDNLVEIMDPQYLEHDSYALFKTIMYGIEKFYRVNETPPVSPNTTQEIEPKNHVTERKRIEVEVVHYLNDIKDNLLSKEDPELVEHLEKCDISLSLFGLRWLRVLFGREFALHDLLVLWDAIFAENEDFSLAGFIMVAMLVVIRTPLLNKDPMICLTYVMHYPTTVDVQYIIEYALYLKNPDHYCKPVSRSFALVSRNNSVIMSSKPASSTNIKTKQINNKPKPTVLKIRMASSADNKAVIDGIALQEPEALKEEMFHAHNIMSVCAIKLGQYEQTLRQSITSVLPQTHASFQALDGIKELCNMLNSRLHVPAVVEPALEANESPNIPSKGQKIKQNEKTVDAKAKNNVQSLQNKEVKLKLFNFVETDHFMGLPSLDPLRIHCDEE